MGHQGRFPARPQPVHPTHNRVRPRYCANQPVSPPTCEEAGRSTVIRDLPLRKDGKAAFSERQNEISNRLVGLAGVSRPGSRGRRDGGLRGSARFGGDYLATHSSSGLIGLCHADCDESAAPDAEGALDAHGKCPVLPADAASDRISSNVNAHARKETTERPHRVWVSETPKEIPRQTAVMPRSAQNPVHCRYCAKRWSRSVSKPLTWSRDQGKPKVGRFEARLLAFPPNRAIQ